MYNFKLSTDSCCDEFKIILEKEGIACLPMPYITEEEHVDSFSHAEEYKYFYDDMRRGVISKTAALSIGEIEEHFENLIKEGNKDIVHIVLSSGLSVVYENTLKAASAVMERNEGVNIFVPDIKSATQGQNYLLQYAKRLRNEGKSGKATSEQLENASKNFHHWFFISDLMHLKRGGRISGAAAVIGTMLKAKPILTIDKDGKLQVVEKQMGTKKAIKALVEKVKDYALDINEQTFYICHSDDRISAEILKQSLVKAFPKIKVIINFIGPVIGSHTGPDTVGIVFMGKERYEPKKSKVKKAEKEEE